MARRTTTTPTAAAIGNQDVERLDGCDLAIGGRLTPVRARPGGAAESGTSARRTGDPALFSGGVFPFLEPGGLAIPVVLSSVSRELVESRVDYHRAKATRENPLECASNPGLTRML